MGVQQTSIFEFLYDTYKCKHIHLYQFFAGVGSQAKALKKIGVDFTDYKIAEWSVPSIIAYNRIHTKDFTDYSVGKSREEMEQVVKNVSLDSSTLITEKQLKSKSDEWIKNVYNNIIATHNLVNICNVHGKDLEIDTTKTNIIFYSFPCQDLSKAGLKKGLSKEGGTRSGLLWEIERILNELTERERESCVLICENVPDLVEVNFVKDFNLWVDALTKFGFTSYSEILNAKDYGIPQNRRRVFMVSLPGSYSYTFPRKIKLEYHLKDMLEEKVDKKYYLSQKMLLGMINTKFHQYQLENRLQDTEDVVDTLTTATGNRCPHLINEGLPIKNNNSKGYEIATDGDGIDISGRMEYHRGTVQKGISQTLTTMGGNDVGVCLNLKVRKLTEKECLRLMGFEDEDYNSIKDLLTASQLYKVAGDSIVVTVLMGIFGMLVGVEDYEQRIKQYVKQLAESK